MGATALLASSFWKIIPTYVGFPVAEVSAQAVLPHAASTAL